MPPSVPRAIAESAGPVCGSCPPESEPPWLPEPEDPEEPDEPEPEPEPPPAAFTSRVREGFGLFEGEQVVVVPRALMVRTPAVKVTLPDFFGVYVPLRSLILMGVLAGIAAALAGPVTPRCRCRRRPP